jgi:sugar O-acyltransferase (sialic acid O-acetyltransferase NeuD family)
MSLTGHIAQPLCIVGTGGFAREVLFIAESLGYREIVCCAKGSTGPKTSLAGWPVIYDAELREKLDYYQIIVAIGDPSVRALAVSSLGDSARFQTLVHPNAVVGPRVSLGEGTIVTAGCVLTCDVEVGAHVHINLRVSIGHDALIRDFCTLSPGVSVSGNVTLESGVYVGTNACLREGLTVCARSVLGMGSVLTRSIDEAAVWVGNPARFFKELGG